MLDNYHKDIFLNYLDSVIINKLYEHKYVHIYLTTGFGKNRFILKYINDNKDKQIALFTLKMGYDFLIEDYNKIYNKNVKNIDNVQYLSSSKFLNYDIDTLICLEHIPISNWIDILINKNRNVNIILITSKVNREVKQVLNGLHTELFDIKRMTNISNSFERSLKINKLVKNINNDN